MKREGLLLLAVSLVSTSVFAGVIWTEDFEGSTWTTLAGGPVPVDTYSDIGADAPMDVTGVTRYNGWGFFGGGQGPHPGDIGLVNNSAPGHGWADIGPTGSTTLTLKNWLHMTREVDLTQVVGNSITLEMDVYSHAGIAGSIVQWGIFLTEPTNDGRNAWEASAPNIMGANYFPSAGDNQHLTVTGDIDTAGFGTATTAYVAIWKSDWNQSVGFDNITVSTIPEPATMGLFSALGAALMFSRRRFRSK